VLRRGETGRAHNPSHTCWNNPAAAEPFTGLEKECSPPMARSLRREDEGKKCGGTEDHNLERVLRTRKNVSRR
jgi:hypothetical protein